MNYYNEIKQELISNEMNKKVKIYSINRSNPTNYYNVGRMLSEAGKHYGEGIVKEYSKRLTSELGLKYSVRLLYKMIKYFNYIDVQKVPTVSAKLLCSHYDELLPFDDINKTKYYIKIIEEQNLSIRQLRLKIKSNEYERLDENVKRKLFNNEKLNPLGSKLSCSYYRKLLSMKDINKIRYYINVCEKK